MEFGNWELRNDSSYYFAKDAMIFPSSNSVDEGKLNTEENVRQIYRDLSDRNFATKYHYFSLSKNVNNTGVIVSPGYAVIQGYHFYAKSTVEVPLPPNGNQIIPYTLGISLSYDAANHVTGDIVNRDLEVGKSEILSGVYLRWFDECQLECHYDDILVLGRAWVQNGKFIDDGTVCGDRIIYHGLEPDPFKDHKYRAESVEIEIYGHKPTNYDTLRDNITQIHSAGYTYDSMHYPVELERNARTKPPTFVTDIQDYINHVPDWYTSKYGDYMSGALRFNNMSIDAMREFANIDNISKDGLTNKFQDSAFISPRTYGDLTRSVTDTVEETTNKENRGYNYDVGGTLMSIVPGTYDTTDINNGYIGTHSALLSQKYGETGLRLHTDNEAKSNGNRNNTTRIVHYNETDSGQLYQNVKNHKIENTSKFIIENIDYDGRISSINMKNGEVFFDSFTRPGKFKEEINNIFGLDYDNDENYKGSGFQFYTAGSNTNKITNIDFRIDENSISIAKHIYDNHRVATRGIQHDGLNNDDHYFDVGVGISYDWDIDKYNTDYNITDYNITKYDVNNHTNTSKGNNTDPYLELGNLRIRSNIISGANVKQNTIEVINWDKNNESKILPYVRIKPRVYSEQYLAEEAIQVGTTKYDDYFSNNAQVNTLNRIILKRVGVNDKDNTKNSFTYYEQDYRLSNGTAGLSKPFIKMRPPKYNIDIQETDSNIEYDEIAGIYSAGNIGCSTGWLETGRNGSFDDENKHERNNPYANDQEWVRFTRFRYDNDKDRVNGGTNVETHEGGYGRRWGDTYNIEFNTLVSNRRANQIIWRYNGSTGMQDENQLNNTPPVVLSYIHDNTYVNQGTASKYTNWDNINNPGYNNGKGTYETWLDHNGVTQHNPTYRVRDFLHLENAGLVVHGDINNPTLSGDSLNTNNHLGVTIVAGRVYNSVYNDFAETFTKNNQDEKYKIGDLVSLNPETGKYEITNNYEDKLVVGTISNSYAFLAGGNRVDNTQDIIELENEYYTVGLCGKVWVNVIEDSYIKPGDLLTSSLERGKACKSEYKTQGTIIGKALSQPKYFSDDEEYKVLMLIMLQ